MRIGKCTDCGTELFMLKQHFGNRRMKYCHKCKRYKGEVGKPQKTFRLHWSKPVYGTHKDKTVYGLKMFTSSNGFDAESRRKIAGLRIGKKYVEAHPLGPGLIVRRIR